jgi:VCBS repeat-containing protein
MAIITKAEASTLSVTYQDALAERVYTFLRNRAQGGFVGGQFTYTTEDTGPKAQAVKAALEAAGWVVVVDGVNRTVTIS